MNAFVPLIICLPVHQYCTGAAVISHRDTGDCPVHLEHCLNMPVILLLIVYRILY